jgi:putative redox protein
VTTVVCKTNSPNQFPQTVELRSHSFGADVGPSSGGTDSSPSPHDYFDAALATCKALTAMWYAKQKGIPLERVESHVESDASEERKGVYRLRVRNVFEGPMTDEQRASLHRAVGACPVHKLMTTAKIEIETEPTL